MNELVLEREDGGEVLGKTDEGDERYKLPIIKQCHEDAMYTVGNIADNIAITCMVTEGY